MVSLRGMSTNSTKMYAKDLKLSLKSIDRQTRLLIAINRYKRHNLRLYFDVYNIMIYQTIIAYRTKPYHWTSNPVMWPLTYLQNVLYEPSKLLSS